MVDRLWMMENISLFKKVSIFFLFFWSLSSALAHLQSLFFTFFNVPLKNYQWRQFTTLGRRGTERLDPLSIAL